MKLQVNNSGAWKQVLWFDIADLERVKAAGHELALCGLRAETRFALRILDGQEADVLRWSLAGGWHVPRWAKGYEIVP